MSGRSGTRRCSSSPPRPCSRSSRCGSPARSGATRGSRRDATSILTFLRRGTYSGATYVSNAPGSHSHRDWSRMPESSSAPFLPDAYERSGLEQAREQRRRARASCKRSARAPAVSAPAVRLASPRRPAAAASALGREESSGAGAAGQPSPCGGGGDRAAAVGRRGRLPAAQREGSSARRIRALHGSGAGQAAGSRPTRGCSRGGQERRGRQAAARRGGGAPGGGSAKGDGVTCEHQHLIGIDRLRLCFLRNQQLERRTERGLDQPVVTAAGARRAITDLGSRQL